MNFCAFGQCNPVMQRIVTHSSYDGMTVKPYTLLLAFSLPAFSLLFVFLGLFGSK